VGVCASCVLRLCSFSVGLYWSHLSVLPVHRTTPRMKQARRDTKSSGTRLAGKSPCTANHRTRRPNPVRDGWFGCDSRCEMGTVWTYARSTRRCIHVRFPPFLPQASLLQSKDTCRQERRPCARSPMPFAITQMVMSLSATLCRYGLAFFPACARLWR
jgi:hypothetical protein